MTKITEQQKHDFRRKVKTRLENIEIPGHLRCQNVHCKDASHRASLDKLMYDVLSTIEDAAAIRVPVDKGRKNKQKVPSWNY